MWGSFLATQKSYSLHEVLLAGWGCPIGEMFDLEKLSEHCKAVGRYSFFLSSMPLKVGYSFRLGCWMLLIVTCSRLLVVSLVHPMLLRFSELVNHWDEYHKAACFLRRVHCLFCHCTFN